MNIISSLFGDTISTVRPHCTCINCQKKTDPQSLPGRAVTLCALAVWSQPGPAWLSSAACIICSVRWKLSSGGNKSFIVLILLLCWGLQSISRSLAVTECSADHTDASLRKRTRFPCWSYPTLSPSTFGGTQLEIQVLQPDCNLPKDHSFCFLSEQIYYGYWRTINRLFHCDNWAERPHDHFPHFSPRNYLLSPCSLSDRLSTH